MSLLDLIALVILAISVVGGFRAGFARSGIGFAAGILGIVFGFWFYGTPAAWVQQYIHSLWISNLLGFLIVYWMFLIAGAILGRILQKLFKWTGLSWIDRFLGAVFGLVRGALITVAFVAVLLAFAPKPMPNWMVNSRLMPYAAEAASAITALAPHPIKEAFRHGLSEIRDLWDQQLRKGREELNALKPGATKPGATKPGASKKDK